MLWQSAGYGCNEICVLSRWLIIVIVMVDCHMRIVVSDPSLFFFVSNLSRLKKDVMGQLPDKSRQLVSANTTCLSWAKFVYCILLVNVDQTGSILSSSAGLLCITPVQLLSAWVIEINTSVICSGCANLMPFQDSLWDRPNFEQE